MRRTLKRLTAFGVASVILFSLCGCGEKADKQSGNKATLNIAYQGGIGYAPVHIAQAQKLIEENYDGEVEITFTKLDSGAAINEGIIGGTIDIGCMGIAPAITAVANGVPAKIMSNLCSQSHGLMTNSKSIKSLKDIKSGDKIALVNTGSIQHILLAMAADKELGDAHALDNNIAPMAHAEGMASLESGTVALHLTSSPFIRRERGSEKFTEIKAVNEIWQDGNSFLAALATKKLYNENKPLYDAVVAAFEKAVDVLNNDKQTAAKIEAEYLEQEISVTLDDLNDKTCMFFTELKGVSQMADFMYKANFSSKKVTLEELKFDNVTGD